MAQHYYYVLLSNDYVMSDLTDLSSQHPGAHFGEPMVKA